MPELHDVIIPTPLAKSRDMDRDCEDIMAEFDRIQRRYMLAIWPLTILAAGLMIAAIVLSLGV